MLPQRHQNLLHRDRMNISLPTHSILASMLYTQTECLAVIEKYIVIAFDIAVGLIILSFLTAVIMYIGGWNGT